MEEWTQWEIAAMTLAVGIVGAAILYTSIKKSPSQNAAQLDSVKTPLQKLQTESKSDFLRNLHELKVCTPNGVYSSMLETVYNNIVPVTEQDILNGMDTFLLSCGIKLNKEGSNVVVQMLTVTPSMNCLFNANIMPPAMFQPTYTLLVCSDGTVRCSTHGYVGSPVMGPPDPSKKYTKTCMRLITDDTNMAVLGECINVRYSISDCERGWTPIYDSSTLAELVSNKSSGDSKWIEYLTN